MKKTEPWSDNKYYDDRFKSDILKSFVGIRNGEIIKMDDGQFYSYYKRMMIDFYSPDKQISPMENSEISLVQKYRDSQLVEPLKTFKSVGIINNENEFTREGWQLFQQWLINKFGDEFKTDVVDKLVKTKS